MRRRTRTRGASPQVCGSATPTSTYRSVRSAVCWGHTPGRRLWAWSTSRSSRPPGKQAKRWPHDLRRQLARASVDPYRTLRRHRLRQVELEVGVRVRKAVVRNPQQLAQQLELLVEGLALASLQALHECLVRHKRRVSERGVHPEQQVGIERAIVRTADVRMYLIDRARSAQRSLAVAENYSHRHPDRAAEAADGVRAKVRMLIHTGGDFGMRDLHEQRATASEQEDVLAVYAPGDRVLREQAGPHHAILLTWARSSSRSGPRF